MHVLSSTSVIALIYFTGIAEARLATMNFDLGSTLSISYQTLPFTRDSGLKVLNGKYVNGIGYFAGLVMTYSLSGIPTLLPYNSGYIMSLEVGKSCLDPLTTKITYNFVDTNYPFVNNFYSLFLP